MLSMLIGLVAAANHTIRPQPQSLIREIYMVTHYTQHETHCVYIHLYMKWYEVNIVMVVSVCCRCTVVYYYTCHRTPSIPLTPIHHTPTRDVKFRHTV